MEISGRLHEALAPHPQKVSVKNLRLGYLRQIPVAVARSGIATLSTCLEMMATTWKKLEDHVRGIAELRWNSKCQPEHIDGVDFDGVVRVSADEIVLIEITQNRTLAKVRDDLNKIAPAKLRLATEGIICRAFVILNEEPTNSMIEAGRKAHIQVISAATFERSFFDFSAYDRLRTESPFGSAVDSKTGKNDPRQFVAVRYAEVGRSESITIADLATRLLRGGKIALTGDFGTGKSRCVREVYKILSQKFREAGAFPIAINLRDHWSASNALEILAGHLGNIGLSSSIDNIVRLLNAGNLILLLDGFDEIGAQSHDMRVDDRRALRLHAVRGVRDLIAKSKTGILVKRSHFFDSDEEMLQSLGMQNARMGASVISAPEEFTKQEGEDYLGSLGVVVKLPSWLPKKPLVFQVLIELKPEDVTRILAHEHGEFEFWGAFIYASCMRESHGVSNSIAPQTIKFILLDLAAKSRYSSAFLGRLSPRDIDDSYERAVGTAPDQTGRQLLSRMCTLGRIEPESPDRQFVDSSVVDVLRAECLISDAAAMSNRDNNAQWKQSLRVMGAFHAASLIRFHDLDQFCFSYVKKFEGSINTKKIGELVGALTLIGKESIDFQGLNLINSEIPVLNLGDRMVSNIAIKNSQIDLLILNHSPVTEKNNLLIDGCFLSLAAGISDPSGLPAWITNTEVIQFDRLSNASRIKESSVAPNQKLLLAIIHKIFFQAGSGREEASLLKGGYGQKYSPKLVDSILKMLIKEALIEKFKGDNGFVYKPIRRHTERMSRIRAELTLSEDPIWTKVLTYRE